MMQASLGIARENVLDYLIVISPPPELKNVVYRLKRDFYEIIGDYKYRNSIPHITICKSVLTFNNEERVLSEWATMINQHDSFVLKVKGFNTFESSGTIYLETNFPETLKNLRRSFYIKNKEMRISRKGYHLISKPHITIGSGFRKDELLKLKEITENVILNTEIEVKSLVGLRAELTDRGYQKSRNFNLHSY